MNIQRPQSDRGLSPGALMALIFPVPVIVMIGFFTYGGLKTRDGDVMILDEHGALRMEILIPALVVFVLLIAMIVTAFMSIAEHRAQTAAQVAEAPVTDATPARGIRTTFRRARHDERGSISPMIVVLIPALILMVGLVVDGGGKIQANDRAQAIASGASRSAANALASQVIIDGALRLDVATARQTALDYIEAGGMTGTVDIVGDRITVNVQTEYATKFIAAIGINSLPAEATATAQLITQ